MLSPDRNEHVRTFDLGLQALAKVKKHRTSAEPAAYEVWYEHVAGRHRKLSADLKARSERGDLTDLDVRELHAIHLSSLRVSERIEEIGSGTQSEMASLLSALRGTVDDLGRMDGDLRQTADRLALPDITTTLLRSLVDAALTTTREVCDANAALQTRVAETEGSVAALRLALDEARGEALTDGLTGLFNRRAFDEQYKARFDKAQADNVPLCLFMLDIDHFKSFNDTHGHAIGDQVIRLVGSCISQRLGPPDLPTRFGGEEFAVISLGRSMTDALVVAEDIRRRIDTYQIVQQGTNKTLGKVTVSIGIASLRATDTMATLLDRADECLYEAKRNGRNRIIADPYAQAA